MKNKETILLVVPSIGGGGRERIAVNTAECLRELFDVKVITFTEKKDSYECSCEVINIKAFSSGNSKVLKALTQMKRAYCIASFQRKYGAKVIISFGEAANLSAVLSKKFGAVNVVTAVHGFAEVLNENRMKYILQNSDRVVCISQEMRFEIERKYGRKSSLCTIENGYNIDEINRKKTIPIGELDGSPKLIAMGRLNEVKGFERMLLSVYELQKEYPQIALYILGEGELRGKLENISEALQIQNHVYFLGNHKNPFPYISAADVYLLTSHNEGFPNALIEALACQTPIVSVECKSGPREILDEEYSNEKIVGIKPARYGILVEDSNEDSEFGIRFAEAVSFLLKNENLREEYKMKSLKRSKDFSIERYREKIVELIQSF